MAELLTNNPDAMKSIAGYSPKSTFVFFGGPCGLFWFSSCSYSNFNDWFATLKARFKILNRNYQKLVESSKKPGKELNASEVLYKDEIQILQDTINDLKKIPGDLSNKEYYQKIADIQSNLANTNALIESVQESLESRDERTYIVQYLQGPNYVSSGINRQKSSIDTFLVAGLLGLTGYFVYKIVKKP